MKLKMSLLAAGLLIIPVSASSVTWDTGQPVISTNGSSGACIISSTPSACAGYTPSAPETIDDPIQLLKWKWERIAERRAAAKTVVENGINYNIISTAIEQSLKEFIQYSEKMLSLEDAIAKLEHH